MEQEGLDIEIMQEDYEGLIILINNKALIDNFKSL